jgi:hypothetical protein
MKDMPEMSIAACTEYFGPRHVHAPVRRRTDVLWCDRRREARQAGIGSKFGMGIKEIGATAGAPVDAVAMKVMVPAREGSFRPSQPGDIILFMGEAPFPFRIAPDYPGNQFYPSHICKENGYFHGFCRFM